MALLFAIICYLILIVVFVRPFYLLLNKVEATTHSDQDELAVFMAMIWPVALVCIAIFTSSFYLKKLARGND